MSERRRGASTREGRSGVLGAGRWIVFSHRIPGPICNLGFSFGEFHAPHRMHIRLVFRLTDLVLLQVLDTVFVLPRRKKVVSADLEDLD